MHAARYFSLTESQTKFLMADTSLPLEFPDYRRLSRVGEGGRIFESRVKESPKIFCPVLIRAKVALGKSRNGVAMSLPEISDIVELSMNISGEMLIDINENGPDAFDVIVRGGTTSSLPTAGDSFELGKSDAAVTIESIVDTVSDESVERRSAISALLSADVYADSVYITLPQTWVIPDPEFRPRTSTLPLYAGSFWLSFFKSVWGLVSGANLVFGQDGPGLVGLAVKFKEIKSMRQCVLSLFDRYLIHPKEGFGMRPTNLRVVRHSSVTAKKTIGGPVTPLPIGSVNTAASAFQAASAYASSKEVPLTVSEAFQKILERVERLDRENQRLLSMLVDDVESPEPSTSRERSPRGIPSTGLPPWRAGGTPS
jgi:hypothetical protein